MFKKLYNEKVYEVYGISSKFDMTLRIILFIFSMMCLATLSLNSHTIYIILYGVVGSGKLYAILTNEKMEYNTKMLLTIMENAALFYFVYGTIRSLF